MTRDDARSLAMAVLKDRGLDEDTILLELTPELLDRITMSRLQFTNAMIEILSRREPRRNDSPGHIRPSSAGWGL